MNELLLSAAFVQINTIKGYRCLDDAGKIMNRWDEEFPAKRVGADGLDMSNDGDVLRAIKVTVDRIWLHFVSPQHANSVVKHASVVLAEMCGVMEIQECRRIGMRLQYVRAAPNLSDAVKGLANALLGSEWQEQIEHLSDGRSFTLALGLVDADLHIGFKASTALLNPKLAPTPTETLPRQVVLLDFDLYTEERTSITQLPKFLKRAEKWISQHLPEYTALAYKEAQKNGS